MSFSSVAIMLCWPFKRYGCVSVEKCRESADEQHEYQCRVNVSREVEDRGH